MNEMTTTVLDPLDTNVNDINTNRPIIPPSNYDLVVKEAKKDKTKAGGDCIKIQFATTTPIMDVTGKETVEPGFPIFHQITTSPTGKLTNQMIAKSVASLAKAAQVSGTVRTIIDNPQVLCGRTVRAKVAVSKETSEFASRNEVKDFIVA